MNKFLKGLMVAAFVIAPVAVQAQQTIKLISMPPGGSWYSYGSTFGEIISKSKGDLKLEVEVLPRGGGMANPVAVNRGLADLGFVTSNAAVWARDGIGEEFKERKSEDITTVVGGLQISYTTVVARKAYVDQTGNDTLEKVIAADKPPRIAMKPTGSQVPIIANYMFEALGTSLEELRKKGAIIQVETAQIAQMLRDGTADVYIENSPIGQATMTEATLTSAMVFLPISETVLKHMEKLGMPRGTMPAGSYQGLDTGYINPTSPTLLIANRNKSEDVIYQVTKALVEARDEIAKTYAPLAGWDPKAGAQPDQAILELHPGAARYYREQGWID
ncbi:MAG: TAXI family TRAP transporter solute-binding subunit [Candidatus Competibacteraceae bacterium]|nr:TAXI family TRAP transporter solute-binding subunit [Candidatus Competibacteraceae bacterium]